MQQSLSRVAVLCLLILFGGNALGHAAAPQAAAVSSSRMALKPGRPCRARDLRDLP